MRRRIPQPPTAPTNTWLVVWLSNAQKIIFRIRLVNSSLARPCPPLNPRVIYLHLQDLPTPFGRYSYTSEPHRSLILGIYCAAPRPSPDHPPRPDPDPPNHRSIHPPPDPRTPVPPVDPIIPSRASLPSQLPTGTSLPLPNQLDGQLDIPAQPADRW